jgi:type IV secretory pathway component VirB8
VCLGEVLCGQSTVHHSKIKLKDVHNANDVVLTLTSQDAFSGLIRWMNISEFQTKNKTETHTEITIFRKGNKAAGKVHTH